MADAKYLQEAVGPALTAGLASVAAVQPDDPVDYLAHWLLKYLAVEEKRAKLAEAEQIISKERQQAQRQAEQEQDKEAERLRTVQAIKDRIMSATTLDKLLGDIVTQVMEHTRAANCYIALLEKATPPEGKAEPPPPEAPPPPAPAEGEEPPPPPAMPAVTPTFCVLRYVRANADNAFVVGKELRSPALGGKETVSFQAVEKRGWAYVRSVMESRPPLVFHDMPLPGSFAAAVFQTHEGTAATLPGAVLGLIAADTVSPTADTALEEADLHVLREVADAAGRRYERLDKERAEREAEEDAIAHRLLEEDIRPPEDEVPGDADSIDDLKAKLEAAVGGRLAAVRALIRDRLPAEPLSETGRAMAHVAAYAPDTPSHAVVAALCALLHCPPPIHGGTWDAGELVGLAGSVHPSAPDDAALDAAAAALAAAQISAASADKLEFPARLLLALLMLLIELGSGLARRIRAAQAAADAAAAAEAAAAEAAAAAEPPAPA